MSAQGTRLISAIQISSTAPSSMAITTTVVLKPNHSSVLSKDGTHWSIQSQPVLVGDSPIDLSRPTELAIPRDFPLKPFNSDEWKIPAKRTDQHLPGDKIILSEDQSERLPLKPGAPRSDKELLTELAWKMAHNKSDAKKSEILYRYRSGGGDSVENGPPVMCFSTAKNVSIADCMPYVSQTNFSLSPERSTAQSSSLQQPLTVVSFPVSSSSVTMPLSPKYPLSTSQIFSDHINKMISATPTSFHQTPFSAAGIDSNIAHHHSELTYAASKVTGRDMENLVFDQIEQDLYSKTVMTKESPGSPPPCSPPFPKTKKQQAVSKMCRGDSSAGSAKSQNPVADKSRLNDLPQKMEERTKSSLLMTTCPSETGKPPSSSTVAKVEQIEQSQSIAKQDGKKEKKLCNLTFGEIQEKLIISAMETNAVSDFLLRDEQRHLPPKLQNKYKNSNLLSANTEPPPVVDISPEQRAAAKALLDVRLIFSPGSQTTTSAAGQQNVHSNYKLCDVPVFYSTSSGQQENLRIAPSVSRSSNSDTQLVMPLHQSRRELPQVKVLTKCQSRVSGVSSTSSSSFTNSSGMFLVFVINLFYVQVHADL